MLTKPLKGWRRMMLDIELQWMLHVASLISETSLILGLLGARSWLALHLFDELFMRV